MDAQAWAVILLLFSLILLFAEVFIPSGGLIFFASMVCLAGALWSAWNAWWGSNPLLWWAFVAGVIVLLPSSLAAAVYTWPHTRIGRQMEPPSEEELTPYVEEQQRLSQLVGQMGVTVTPLMPAGIARIGNQRVHCFSEGMIVGSGERVKVLAVRGNLLLVRQASPQDDADARSTLHEPRSEKDPSQTPPLDFDLPAG